MIRRIAGAKLVFNSFGALARSDGLRRYVPRLLVPLALALIAIAIFNSRLVPTRTPLPPAVSADSLQMKAVIVDQLALTFANPDFIDRATSTLKLGGYDVDYVNGNQVTVEFYRRLATHGYRLVILRVHSPYLVFNGSARNEVALLSGETYKHSNPSYQRESSYLTILPADQTGVGQPLIGVSKEFVGVRMDGSLRDATVILMGCSGLKSDGMAKALVSRGARYVIGWDEAVSGSFADTVTEPLLGYLLVDNLRVPQAVSRANREFGPDPLYGGNLVSYP